MSKRIPSLDGLRAISILLVVISHLSFLPAFRANPAFKQLMVFGPFGVRIFFVISGYLITSLLLKELGSTNRISLKRFYYRRALRIFPAFYVFLTVIAVLLIFAILPTGVAGDLRRSLPFAAIYLSNYVHPGGWFTAHTWSLAVEEQFYLLWPLTLKLFGIKRGIIISILICIVCPIVRVAMAITMILIRPHTINYEMGWTFETVADAVAIGCLLALVRTWLNQQNWYNRIMDSRLFFAVPATAVLLTISLARFSYGYFYLIQLLIAFSIINLCVGLTVDWCMKEKSVVISRILNCKPMVWIGVLSYSLYLWQGLVISPYSNLGLPLSIGILLLIATASFYLIETPALAFRNRYEAQIISKHHGAAQTAKPINSPAVLTE